MAKKINISGEIGWDYTAYSIRDSLRNAKGEDVEIEIASPGGDVFDGIEIYNAIRDYKRDYPGAQIMGTLKGVVASIASYIASNPAFDLVAAEDNAVYMIHNPWMLAIGDHNEMAKQADFLSGLAGILAAAYQSRTGKSEKEIRALMDDTTWYFGAEIKAAGFVDEMVASGESVDDDKKKKALAYAAGSFEAMKRHAQEKTDAQKVAAMIRASSISSTPPTVAPGNPPEPSGKTGETMYKSLAEFRQASPDLYTEAVEASVKEERSRIVALLDMKKKYGEKVGAVAERCEKAITEGESANAIAIDVMALVTAAFESAPPLETGANGSATGEQQREEAPDGWRPIKLV